MKFLKTAAVAATLAVFATGAQAATYDFAADADAFATEYGFEGSFDQVYNSPVFFPLLHGDNTDGGLTVNASTVEGGPHPESHPFMDSNTAGLGVCKSGFGVVSGFDPLVSNCNGSSDDNLLWPEILVLTFSDPTSLTGLLIRDAGHALITADYAIDIFDGSSWHTLAASLGVVQGLDDAEARS